MVAVWVRSAAFAGVGSRPVGRAGAVGTAVSRGGPGGRWGSGRVGEGEFGLVGAVEAALHGPAAAGGEVRPVGDERLTLRGVAFAAAGGDPGAAEQRGGLRQRGGEQVGVAGGEAAGPAAAAVAAGGQAAGL